jgi:predicted RNA-binding Zn ribbon-like protein
MGTAYPLLMVGIIKSVSGYARRMPAPHPETSPREAWPWAGAPWDWLGEPLAVDFANTIRRRGDAHVELLRDGGDLLAWCAGEAGRVRAPGGAEARARLAEVRAARDDVFAVLRAAAEGRTPPAAAARRVDASARRHPVVPQLCGRPAVPDGLDAVDELLARVAAATIELALAGSAGGLAFCDAPSCGQLFMRERGGQVWCGAACGTRARVARHAARRRR